MGEGFGGPAPALTYGTCGIFANPVSFVVEGGDALDYHLDSVLRLHLKVIGLSLHEMLALRMRSTKQLQRLVDFVFSPYSGSLGNASHL